MSLYERIAEVLEHYDYCLIVTKKSTTDNVINVEFPTTKDKIFRDITIHFGAAKVSKTTKGVKVTL